MAYQEYEMYLAFYLRLSMEDGDLVSDEKKTESNSIAHQRELISQYRRERHLYPGMKVLEFIDDGYSGTSFNRPALMELLALVREKRICCIIVKDISRFGRDYVDVGDYLEQIFPFLGVRFISVNDHYDSDDYLGTTGGIDLALRSLFYDWYSKDLSMKMRSALKIRRERGEYMGAFAPFGYKKSKEKRNSLEIDEESAVYVRRIFQLAGLGKSTGEIAKKLNKEGVPTPSQYQYEKGIKKKCAKEKFFWKNSTVRKILQNPVYLGVIVTPKLRVTEVGSKRLETVPEEERMYISDKHEAIITEEAFAEAAKVLRDNGEQSGKKHKPREIRPLHGKLKCGGCRNNLVRLQQVKTPVWICERTRFVEIEDCFCGRLKEHEIEQLVLQEIKKKIDDDETVSSSKKEKSSVLRNGQKKDIQRKRESLKVQKQYLYEEYKTGKIEKNIYLNKINTLREEETWLQALLSAQENTNEKEESRASEARNADELTRELIDRYIKEILVYSEIKIEIIWNL